MQHEIARWNRDHTAELQIAWMNGSGMMVWENVFGSWVGWNERDRSLLRAMLPIQRRYARIFAGEGWTPLVETLQPDVYASLWEGDGLRLWTLANRSEEPVEGALLRVTLAGDERAYDLIRGEELKGSAGERVLAGGLPPRGVGAFLVARKDAGDREFREFLAGRRERERRRSGETRFPARHARLKPVARTRLYREGAEVLAGMAVLPAARRKMTVEFRIRECGFYDSQYEPFAETGPRPLHGPLALERDADLSPYAIDLAPVTNAQFHAFLQSSGYAPRHAENFLKHWVDGKPPAGREDHPTVYVDLDDARAYARWAGKRLPTEEEWQHAAEGPEARRFPWGDSMEPGRCNGGETGGTTPATAFPSGRSPFGLYDCCGNVWEWTESERSDGRSRFAILKGGSFYKASGSDWYFDGGPQPCRFAAKMLLTWPGLDRCATVGFRCAADMEGEKA
jgi:formylglycine-generating enzyme required for sulfatase activity